MYVVSKIIKSTFPHNNEITVDNILATLSSSLALLTTCHHSGLEHIAFKVGRKFRTPQGPSRFRSQTHLWDNVCHVAIFKSVVRLYSLVLCGDCN